MLKSLFAGTLVVATVVQSAQAQTADRGDRLYRMMLVRAAPGRLLDLVQQVRTNAVPDGAFIFRHSQGDHWDLLVLVPGRTYAELFGGDRPVEYADPALVAWRQDEIVRGPDLGSRSGFADAGLYHIEMFVALAGKRDELLREREMENAYVAELGRPASAIFVRDFGAEWDSFTIGAYKSWTHYAERDRIAADRAARAAESAGFKGDAEIGPYLRSLIASHHDTLATPVR